MKWSLIKKKEEYLAYNQHELYRAQAQLDEKQRELDEVQAKFDAAMNEKQELLDDAESCRRKMTAATQLIEGSVFYAVMSLEYFFLDVLYF